MRVNKEKEVKLPENNMLFLIKLYDQEKNEGKIDFDEWLDIVLFTGKTFQKSR